MRVFEGPRAMEEHETPVTSFRSFGRRTILLYGTTTIAGSTRVVTRRKDVCTPGSGPRISGNSGDRVRCLDDRPFSTIDRVDP